jgi:hypothetical protein
MLNKARELVKGVANLTHCAVLGIAYCPNFTELPGLTVTNREVRGSRAGNTTAMVRRPKKPPSPVARRSQNQNPATTKTR